MHKDVAKSQNEAKEMVTITFIDKPKIGALNGFDNT